MDVPQEVLSLVSSHVVSLYPWDYHLHDTAAEALSV